MKILQQVWRYGWLVTAIWLTAATANAETISVKYGPANLDISSFECTDTLQSSFVRRVCYDAPKSFMVIKLKETWYPYCAIDARTVQDLITAESVGKYYNERIRSKRDGAHGPFDCRDHPMPIY